MDKKLILIVYYGRSGSAFIHSLLDGHPQLICMPPVLNSFYSDIEKYSPDLSNAALAYNFFTKYYGPVVNHSVDTSEQDYIKLKYSEFNCVNSPLTDEKVFSELFFRFYKRLVGKFTDPSQRLFICMHYAYDAMLRGYDDIEFAEQKKIVFQLHNPVYKQIAWYAKIDSGAYLLQMIRSPLVTLRSIYKRLLEYDRFRFNPGLMEKYFRQITFGATQYPYTGIDHFAVKLEDVHCRPEETLRKLTHRLRIDWWDGILSSSFSLQPWGNVTGREHISGFAPESVKTDVSDLFPENDMQFLQPMLIRRYEHWDYRFPMSIRGKVPKTHYLLVEYLSYINDYERALICYEKQLPIHRSGKLSFLFEYALNFKEPIVDKL